MNYVVFAIFIAFGMLAGMLLFMELGRRIGFRQRAKDPEGGREGLSAVEGAVFGLLGLLIAFTFSGAAARFDVRRHLIVEEANAIGTAYLRIDLLPPGAQPGLRESFRQYLDARLAVYRALPDVEAAKAELARSTVLQGDIWGQAVSACQQVTSPATMTLVLSALNEMIDITTTRTVALQTHPPPIIFGMLAALALASSMLAGYGMSSSKKRSWLHILGFVAIMSITIYVIFDLEFPRLGFIRIDAFDQVLVDVRQSMH
jgi:hypothetical protein